jgi:hypothetical protein
VPAPAVSGRCAIPAFEASSSVSTERAVFLLLHKRISSVSYYHAGGLAEGPERDALHPRSQDLRHPQRVVPERQARQTYWHEERESWRATSGHSIREL